MNYVPLHVHTDASSDGAGTVASLVAEAKRLGMEALAMTDHGTLANSVAFWSECTEQGIKPILGMEAYLSYRGSRHHLTLLSLNENGFNNLIGLDSESHDTGWTGGYPLVTMDSLERWSGDLFTLTGCASSALYKGSLEDAKVYVGELVDVMGGTRYVGLETMFLGTHNTWERPMELSKWSHLPYIITNDSHFPCQHQFPAHQAICSARRGFTYDSQHLWLKSGSEIMHEAKKWVSEDLVYAGLLDTQIISDRVVSWNMKAAPNLPRIDDVEGKLREKLTLAYSKQSEKNRTRKDRLQYEWSVLKTKGFLDYIYILWDIVSWAKGQGIYVGPGRGSGGGSYVLFLLGITTIDPLEHNLLFERFINPTRADYPDVDVDFESDRRQEVMNYANEKWSTVPIATYSCYSHKSAVHDIARTLTIPKDLEVQAADAGADSPIFEEFLAQHKDAHITYQTMLGQIRHKGKHAAGVIIANRPVPIERAPNGELVAAWAEGMNTKDLSKVGIVKYDLLGLTALSQLKMMRELTGVDADLDGFWHYDDPKVFDLFCQGDVSGIFQWSGSEGIRDLTMRVAPRNFYDLATCNALYRPGALDAGTAEQYPEFMKEPRKLHPRIDKHLEKTYGVLCYQEQVMAVVAEVMSVGTKVGGDLSMADNARKLLSKAAVGDLKWEEQIEELHKDFLHHGTMNSFERDLLDQLWHEIYTHSGYSYNLSHASAYTMISYQMAWYKVYHRAAFTVAVLQYDKANAQTYIIDAVSHGLRIEMPNVNHSSKGYVLHDNTIYLPLSDINFLGDKAVDSILEGREKGGAYDSYANFASRVAKKQCNNRAKGMLERIGAFKGLDGNPSDAIDKYEELPISGIYQNQLEVLGYVIPSATLLNKMQELEKLPAKKGFTRYAGFISKAVNKKSLHGDYTVFTLSPSGSFWCRSPRPSLKVGVFVSGTKSKFGNSTDVKTYKLDTGD